MVSPAQGLLMMQGGRDRTGLASLLDSVGTPGADIIAQRRADAAEQEAMDEYERREAERLAELQALIGGEEDIQESDDLSMMQSLFGDEEGSYTSDAAVGQNAMLAANLAAAVPAGMAGSKVAKAIMPDSPGFFKSVGNVFKRKLPGMLTRRAALAGTGVGMIPAAVSLIPEVGYEVAKAYYPEQIGAFEEKVGGGIKSGAETIGSGFQSSIDYLRDLTGMEDVEGFETRTPEEIERDNEVASQYFMNPYNDGGRVGAFSGGIMNNLLGSPQMQSMIQQYRQPTTDFSQISIGGPDGPRTIPAPGGPGVSPPPPLTSAAPPQAYTPFVSTMPLYDPSTRGTGLPSTAGMADPYFVYDPYSPVGAFDAPPSTAGGFLTQKQIDETFKDMDKFTLAKQKEKADAAAKAKTETRRNRGGEGNTPEARARRDALTERSRDARNRSRGFSGRGTSDPGGQAARGV